MDSDPQAQLETTGSAVSFVVKPYGMKEEGKLRELDGRERIRRVDNTDIEIRMVVASS